MLEGLRLSFTIGTTQTVLTFNSALTAIQASFNVSSVRDPLSPPILQKATSQLTQPDVIDSYGFVRSIPGIMFGLDVASCEFGSDGLKLQDIMRLVGLDNSLLDLDTPLKVRYEPFAQGSLLKDPINGVWYHPQDNERTTLAICAEATAANTNNRLLGLNFDVPGCLFSDCTIMVMEQGHFLSTTDVVGGVKTTENFAANLGSLCIQATLARGSSDTAKSQCWIGVSGSQISLTMQWYDTKDLTQSPHIEDFLDWILHEAGIDHGSFFKDFDSIITAIFSKLKLREANFTVMLNEQKFHPSFKLVFEVDLTGHNWGLDKSTSIPLQLDFDYVCDGSSSGNTYLAFKGALWSRMTQDMIAAQRLSEEASLAPLLMPDSVLTPQFYLDLSKLGDAASRLEKIKGIVPEIITDLSWEISPDVVKLSGTMQTTAPDEDAGDSSLVDLTKPLPKFLQFRSVTISAELQ